MERKTMLTAAAIAAIVTTQLVRAGAIPFEHAAIDDSVKDPWAKMVADIDGDGFVDVIIGGRSGPLVWYRYPDWTKAVIAKGGYRTVDGAAGDIDGDGDLDIVMGGLLWYENPLPAAKPGDGLWKAREVADHRTHDLELADLDGDGRLDIVTRDQSDFGHKAGNKIYVWQQKARNRWDHSIIDCPHGEGLALADMDRDSDPDIVIGGIWFENTGSLPAADWKGHKFGNWHPSATVQVADINGDGRVDVVLSPSELKGNWHRLSWFEAPADPRQEAWAEHVVVERIECVIHGLVTADFDGDGAIDIATSEMHQGKDPDEVAVFVNRNSGGAWDKQVLSTKGSHYIQAGDIGCDGDIDLMGANWSGPYQPVEIWENRTGAGQARSGWHGESYRYRVPLRVRAGDVARENAVVEVPLDFGELLRRSGRSAPQKAPAVWAVEVDAAGELLHEMVPVQFDADPDCDSDPALRGTLTFILWGRTAAKTERVFHVYFDFGRHVTMTDVEEPAVSVADGVEHEGQESFKITTPGAVYYYHKQGAGFASIEDRRGDDWLSYNPGVGQLSKSGSGGKYRGTPNMGYPEGYCHPGSDKSTSRLLSPGPVRATIVSQSNDGKWACRWDVFPHYARMTVLKVSHPYWFLYEGTPGGRLDEGSDYCVRCDGTRTAASVRWDGDISCAGQPAEWLYFGDGDMSRVLYLIHHTDDDGIDSYWPMNHEMTVFGFGRQGLNKYMTQTPARFTVGFCEQSDFETVSRAVQSIVQPVVVRVGPPQARPR